MIILAKDNCLASGPVTSKGGNMSYIGEKQIPKYTFSVRVKNWKGRDGQYHSEYLDCELFGASACMDAPVLTGGEKVFVSGTMQTQAWKGRDGEEKSKSVLSCDFVMVARNAAQNAAQSVKQEQGRISEAYGDDDEDDGLLPF